MISSNELENLKCVSVIMPIYNSEKYLQRAIDSVLKQTYTNIELILVDDGSTDNSAQICDAYFNKDSRIKVIHKENGGVSTARNCGIENMQGEYCLFMDSDDILPSEHITCMIKKVVEEKCDVAFCGVARVKDDERREFYLDDSVLSVAQYLYELYLAKKFVTKSSCIGLYKSEIIRQYKLCFPENVICGEDSLFVLKYVSYIKRIGTVKDTIYNYMYDNLCSATSSIYYDHFLIEKERYDITNSIVTDELIRQKIAQLYMDNEIRELVQYITYSTDTARQQLRILREFVRDYNTIYAIKNYKRDSKAKSIWIPLCIRSRQTILLFLCLRNRSKKIKKKKAFVKSAYRQENRV